MAAILVDYENVGQNGLVGISELKKGDNLYIFCREQCKKIRSDYFEKIKASGCTLNIVKLEKAGKNALDFYIATKCGMLVEKGETQIAIISNDKGFEAVGDFIKKEHTKKKITFVLRSTVEKALLSLTAPEDSKRRSEILKKSKMIDLEFASFELQIHREINHWVHDRLNGTQYEFLAEDVSDYLERSKDQEIKNPYNAFLHNFGKLPGTEVYRLIGGMKAYKEHFYEGELDWGPNVGAERWWLEA